MSNKVYYVNEATVARYPELVLGTQLFLAKNQHDIYRVKSPGELFLVLKNDPNSCKYGLYLNEVDSMDPNSREAKGPWEHNQVVVVDFDKLPGTLNYRFSIVHNGVEAESGICVDPEFRTKFDADEFEELIESLVETHENKVRENVKYLVPTTNPFKAVIRPFNG